MAAHRYHMRRQSQGVGASKHTDGDLIIGVGGLEGDTKFLPLDLAVASDIERLEHGSDFVLLEVELHVLNAFEKASDVDGDTLPRHSIEFVLEGGVAASHIVTDRFHRFRYSACHASGSPGAHRTMKH